MPNPPISFPANFTPVTGMAFANADNSAQPVSATSPLPVSVGATPAGTAHIGSVSVDDVADAAITSGTASSATTVVSAATSGFSGGSFQIVSAGSGCAIVFEQSNDNTNWATLLLGSTGVSNGSPFSSANTAGIYNYSSQAAYVRARVSTYGSGTVSVVLAQKRVAPPLTVSLGGGNSYLGSVNQGLGYTDSTAALGASASFSGTGRASSFAQLAFFNASAFADVAGTLFIDQSLDAGATYQPMASVAVSAGTSGQLSARMTGANSAATLYRVRYVNGAAAQTIFRIASSMSAN